MCGLGCLGDRDTLVFAARLRPATAGFCVPSCIVMKSQRPFTAENEKCKLLKAFFKCWEQQAEPIQMRAPREPLCAAEPEHVDLISGLGRGVERLPLRSFCLESSRAAMAVHTCRGIPSIALRKVWIG